MWQGTSAETGGIGSASSELGGTERPRPAGVCDWREVGQSGVNQPELQSRRETQVSERGSEHQDLPEI